MFFPVFCNVLEPYLPLILNALISDLVFFSVQIAVAVVVIIIQVSASVVVLVLFLL